jgi:dolichyl-phosphate beta-glucosyltransferase
LFLSVIIPAFNEVGRIEKSLEAAFRYFANVKYDVELFVVDDGSTDETFAVCKSIFENKPAGLDHVHCRALTLGRNLGKGATVQHGMLTATGRIRIFTDADFSTPIKEIEKVIPLIQTGGFDVVIGSRAAQHRELVKKHQPWYREAMGRFFNVLVQLFVFRGIADTQCGFKGFSSDAAAYLFSKQKVSGFSFDVEILYLAKKAGYRMKEIAVEWYNDERTTVGALSDSMKMFSELLKIKKLHKP